MAIDNNLYNQALDIKSLPMANASLSEILMFIDARDPAAKYRKIWGSDYAEKAENLWSVCMKAFSDGAEFINDKDELLLCLKYDSAIAPYLTRTESKTVEFYQWILEKLRNE